MAESREEKNFFGDFFSPIAHRVAAAAATETS